MRLRRLWFRRLRLFVRRLRWLRRLWHGLRWLRHGLRRLWRTGKAVLELKALGDEAQRIVSASAGAMVMANPVFLIMLVGSMASVVALAGAAGIIALAYLV